MRKKSGLEEIIYRYTCSNCKVIYYGKSFCHFYTRAAAHMGISNHTGKCLKNVKQSVISDHLLQCNCAINFDDFSILATDCNKFKLLLRESLFIKRDKPILNRTIKSFPLKLFDKDDSFISNIKWLSDFVLIFNSNFILCTDRARICFKCHIEKERKCSFENAPVERATAQLIWNKWLSRRIVLCIQFKYTPSSICLITLTKLITGIISLIL